MKQIQLSVEKAKALFGKNKELDEILKENFSEEELGLKKPLPKTWGELGYLTGYFITDDTIIIKTANLLPSEKNRNVFATETQVNSALAYAQLTQLMKAYNGDWVPDWKNTKQIKYTVDRAEDHIFGDIAWASFNFIALKTPELRDEFMKNFEQLIKQFYQS